MARVAMDPIRKRARVDNLKRHLSMRSVLELHGVELRSDVGPSQFRCPFHGEDRHPSARYYPDTESAYCFTCREYWDVISFHRRMEGLDFWSAVAALESRFGIKPPDESPSDLVVEIEMDQRRRRGRRTGSPEKALEVTAAMVEDSLFKTRGKLGLDLYLKLLRALDRTVGEMEDVGTRETSRRLDLIKGRIGEALAGE